MFAVCRALGRPVRAAPFSPFHPQLAEHFDAEYAEFNVPTCGNMWQRCSFSDVQRKTKPDRSLFLTKGIVPGLHTEGDEFS